LCNDPICFQDHGDCSGPFRFVERVGNFPQAIKRHLQFFVIRVQGAGCCEGHSSATIRAPATQCTQRVEDDGNIDGFLRQGAGNRRQPADCSKGHGEP
jgi:hypothetical protein